MKDPKNLAIIYLVMGVLAIALALYYMSIDASGAVLDWIILGMGVVSIVRGGQQYLQLRAARKPPGQK
ncbi:MAG: hypothetical protein ACOH1Y_04780 [Propionicimonas sp.]